MNIVFIGAGNLATNLAKELHRKSFKILQIYSRTTESAQILANQVEAEYTNDIEKINREADIYIFSVKDSALSELIEKMPQTYGLWIHTSGSIPMDIFKDHTKRYGVIYPLQTFSKNKSVDFGEIPLFIETNNENDLILTENICRKISDKVYNLSSEKRKHIHLSAVFACNFVNHMYNIAGNILKKEKIPFDVLLPLIDETAEKVHTLKPNEAQTGPAVRYDKNIINKHISMLDSNLLKTIYSLISESIHESNK